ncbi:hypothetical protein ACTPL8_000446 [Enterococcus faecium]
MSLDDILEQVGPAPEEKIILAAANRLGMILSNVFTSSDPVSLETPQFYIDVTQGSGQNEWKSFSRSKYTLQIDVLTDADMMGTGLRLREAAAVIAENLADIIPGVSFVTGSIVKTKVTEPTESPKLWHGVVMADYLI